jgi:hypothetical protein
MDETTLTRTLQELAANPPLHPSPSADLRRRAARLRRSRRTGAAGLAAVLVVVALGTVQLASSDRSMTAGLIGPEDWRVGLTQDANPNHATSEALAMASSGAPSLGVYWQGRRLCRIEIGTGGATGPSQCFGAISRAPDPITLAGSDAAHTSAVIAVAPAVALVRVLRSDGTSVDVKPVTGRGFRYPAATMSGDVVDFRAMDAGGHQIGLPVPGPGVVQLRQVESTFTCGSTVPTGSKLVGSGADLRTCYGLATRATTLVGVLADAMYDPSQGWSVQITVAAGDMGTLQQLTQRVAAAAAPRNQLAFVQSSHVLSVAKVTAAIAGPTLVVSGDSDHEITKSEADLLATLLRG